MPRPLTRRTSLLVVALLGAGLLAACGGSGDDAAGGPTSPPAASTPVRPAPRTPFPTSAAPSGPGSAAVPAVLGFDASTVSGQRFEGASLAGRRTVLWFWAPWCTACARAASGVSDAAAALGPDVTVVGVGGLSSSTEDMARFVSDHGLDGFTQLADTSGDLYTRFGVRQQDTYVLVDEHGSTTRVSGYGTTVDLADVVRDTFS